MNDEESELNSLQSPQSPPPQKTNKDCKVKVAVRVRPFNSKELLQNSKPYLITNRQTNQVGQLLH